MHQLATRRPPSPLSQLIRRLMRYFVNGCLVLVPVSVTIYVVYAVLSGVDGWLGLDVPGLGFVLTVSLITAVGMLTRNIIGERLIGGVEAILTRVPLVGLIYTTLRDVMYSLAAQRRSFDRPVLVNLMNGARLVGFMTHEDASALGLGDHVAVYVPQSFNFAGNLLIVARQQVEPLHMDTARAMAFIVSAGLVSAPDASPNPVTTELA